MLLHYCALLLCTITLSDLLRHLCALLCDPNSAKILVGCQLQDELDTLSAELPVLRQQHETSRAEIDRQDQSTMCLQIGARCQAPHGFCECRLRGKLEVSEEANNDLEIANVHFPRLLHAVGLMRAFFAASHVAWLQAELKNQWNSEKSRADDAISQRNDAQAELEIQVSERKKAQTVAFEAREAAERVQIVVGDLSRQVQASVAGTGTTMACLLNLMYGCRSSWLRQNA